MNTHSDTEEIISGSSSGASKGHPIRFTPVQRAQGVTSAERLLQMLCERSFLSLWSYAGIYRDQNGKASGKPGDGKEVCDLLVVFQNHVLIFSDKDCAFPNSGNLELGWSRWYRRAVQKSAEQVYGAERWIKTYPDHLFLDRECTQKFPVELPPPDQAIFHGDDRSSFCSAALSRRCHSSRRSEPSGSRRNGGKASSVSM